MAIREVIFRGKRTDCEAWVEGDLLHYESGEMAICKGFSKYGYEATEIIGRYKVIPETVGQYTGLTDKNGVRIFEGDIVDYISSDVIGNPKTGTIIVEDMTDYDTMIYLNHSDELQIIGNIHDNSELLKGGEENG